MAHELSVRENGFVEMAFVGDRSKIWHGLGNQLTQDSTVDEWKVQAGMDWNIIETPAMFGTQDGTILPFDDKKVLYRSDTNMPLSIVGLDYKVIQPGDVLEFFRDLVSGTDMYIDTAGCLFGGKKFWALANSSKVDYVGRPDDVTKGHLLLTTSSDCSTATVASWVAVRTVCNNTLRLALSESGANRVRVTHRATFDTDMVKRKLGLYDDAWDAYMEAANKMVKIKMTDIAARKFIDDLILSKPELPEESSMQSRNQSDFIMNLYKGNGMGADMTYGNAYGVLQAIIESADHHSRSRAADTRLWGQFYGSGDTLKQDAYDAMLEMI